MFQFLFYSYIIMVGDVMESRKDENKRKQKLHFIIVAAIIVAYIIIKVGCVHSCNFFAKQVDKLYSDGIVTETLKVDKIRTSRYIFLDDELKFFVEYETFEKVGNGYSIKDVNGLKYSLMYGTSDEVNYYDAINTVSKYHKNKVGFFTPTKTIRERTNVYKKIIKLANEGKIRSVEGNGIKGYVINKDNSYKFIIEKDGHKIELIFKGNKLTYDYLISLLGTLQFE